MLRLRSLTTIKFLLSLLVCLNLVNSSSQLKAEPFSWTVPRHNSLDFSGDGRPKRTAGGASRGECQAEQISEHLTALVPDSDVSLTISPSPTFWFYVPYNLISEHSAELVLKDNQGNFIYQNKFSGNEISPGIVNVALPSTVKLPNNQDYSWHFLVYCDRHNSEKFVYVNGLVRRIDSPILQSQFKNIDKEQELILFTQEKIWFDTLKLLAESLRLDPQNQKLKADWFNLLQSIGLEHLADKPFHNVSSELSNPSP